MTPSELYNEVRIVSLRVAESEHLSVADRLTVVRHLQDCQDPAVFGELAFIIRVTSDLSFVPDLERYLPREDPRMASDALWVLCWLGQADKHRDYIARAIEPGFAWDPMGEVAYRALSGIGRHLRAHRDRDFAQTLIRWAPGGVCDPDTLPEWPTDGIRREAMVSGAGGRMGDALGVDPAALVKDSALAAECVRRFIAERQDG